MDDHKKASSNSFQRRPKYKSSLSVGDTLLLFHPSIDRGVAFALFLKYNSGEEMIERWLLGKVDIQDLPKDNLDKHCF